MHKWKQCGQQECTFDPTWCATINDETIIKEIMPLIDGLLDTGRLKKDGEGGTSGGVDGDTTDLMNSSFIRFTKYFSESLSQDQETCNAGDGNALNLPTNLTCDIKKQTYTRTTTTKSYNSAVMMSIVVAVFSCSIMLLGDYESFHFHLSGVRVGCCIVAFVTSSLVYVGSLHLHWSSQNNPTPTDATAQKIWRAFYLFISYVCVHGGLLVLVDVDRSKVVAKDKDKQTLTRDQDFKCCNKTWCKSDSCCGKVLYFGDSFKKEFWDASGKFFWLKLAVVEIIELAIQMNSLAIGATNSHVDDVVLSTIIIATNLIVLPLMIVFGPRCFKSESSYASLAAVMVIEVLFDKLYVGVGVLLRYNTLTQHNMTFTDQASVHLALLLPALMTALDVQDALELAEHMEATSDATSDATSEVISSNENRDDIERSSSFVRVAGQVDKVTHSPVALIIGKGGLLSSIIAGAMLATYILIVATTVRADCETRIGKISTCAQEQYYFTDGFFHKPRCAFEQVTSFQCRTGKSYLATTWLLWLYMVSHLSFHVLFLVLFLFFF